MLFRSLSVGKRKGRNILAFCNAADTNNRNNLTLRISYDEGRTWLKSIPVYKGLSEPCQNYSYSAYSDLVRITGNQIGILYEKDNYSNITFLIKRWK